MSVKDVSFFERILGSKGVVTDEDILNIHNTDWTKKYAGHSKLMLKPSTTADVSAILNYCNEKKLARALRWSYGPSRRIGTRS